jgi:formylglycine-generating enzyme required for sulfatase activity
MSDSMDPFALGGDRFARLERRVRGSADEDFVTLVKLAELDPARDLRFGDFSGVDFSGCHLSGCDFTGANLTGCNFDGAYIGGTQNLLEGGAADDFWFARFDRAQVRREQLRRAGDWNRHFYFWRLLGPAGGDQHLPDLAVFSDSPFAPELVVVPAGEFMMGSPEDEEGRSDSEGSQRQVTIDHRVAIGRFPVTFEEYDHFCQDTRRRKPGDLGWGRGRRPVINVSLQDAQKYCDWMSKATGMTGDHRYRLPSETECEYAIRAGTTTRYWWGNTITPKNANYADSRLSRTSEVGTYPPNPWGLFDMHGNVFEWLADAWHDRYEGAPDDRSAWLDNGPRQRSLRVIRGGSWGSDAAGCRSAYRVGSDGTNMDVGFRVARTLITS